MPVKFEVPGAPCTCYKAAMFETRPIRAVPDQAPRPHYWHVTITETASGHAIHEMRGDERRLLAVIADRDEALEYAERRASKPWRVLERSSRSSDPTRGRLARP